VQYGGVRALNRVDVVLDEGEIVALMGPNGAGKSTVLKAIFGLVAMSAGRIEWRGKRIVPLPHEMVERGIAFVPQGRRVFADLTVEENLEIGGFVVGSDTERKERIGELLEMFPLLAQKRRDRSGVLSGGQQQMLAIARGLMTKPEVLLLDEPSLGLAPKVVREVFDFVKGINEKRGTAVMVVEHNLKSLLEIADRGYILDKGRVVAEGQPKKLVEDGTLERVFTGRLADAS
jgi:branched-chain amino acid transport system ATP-binding protein